MFDKTFYSTFWSNFPYSTFTRLTKWHRMTQKKSRTTNGFSSIVRFSLNEASGTRTPDNLIKSQVLYHLSYTPLFLSQGKCPEPESNQWHEDFQSSALPTELMLHTHLYISQHKCPEPESNQRHEDFQSSALPTELSGQNSGDRIWTYDLRVMSPTSCLTALPRDKN